MQIKAIPWVQGQHLLLFAIQKPVLEGGQLSFAPAVSGAQGLAGPWIKRRAEANDCLFDRVDPALVFFGKLSAQRCHQVDSRGLGRRHPAIQDAIANTGLLTVVSADAV